jgi:hypothetical protein
MSFVGLGPAGIANLSGGLGLVGALTSAIGTIEGGCANNAEIAKRNANYAAEAGQAQAAATSLKGAATMGRIKTAQAASEGWNPALGCIGGAHRSGRQVFAERSHAGASTNRAASPKCHDKPETVSRLRPTHEGSGRCRERTACGPHAARLRGGGRQHE